MRLMDRAENYSAYRTVTMNLFSHWTAPTTKPHLAGPAKSPTAEACVKNRWYAFKLNVLLRNSVHELLWEITMTLPCNLSLTSLILTNEEVKMKETTNSFLT